MAPRVAAGLVLADAKRSGGRERSGDVAARRGRLARRRRRPSESRRGRTAATWCRPGFSVRGVVATTPARERVHRAADVGRRVDRRARAAADRREQQAVVLGQAGDARPLAHAPVAVRRACSCSAPAPAASRVARTAGGGCVHAAVALVAEDLGARDRGAVELAVVDVQRHDLGAVAEPSRLLPATAAASQRATRPSGHVPAWSAPRNVTSVWISSQRSGSPSGLPRSRQSAAVERPHGGGLEHPEHEPSVVHRGRMRERVEAVAPAPTPLRRGGRGRWSRRPSRSRSPRYEARLKIRRELPGWPQSSQRSGPVVAVDATGREVLVVDARPVVVPGRRVERVAMDDQRPDAVRALARRPGRDPPTRSRRGAGRRGRDPPRSGASEVAAWREPSKTVSELHT